MHRFAVVDFVLRRNQPVIGDHPIDPVGAKGAGIAEVMELQGRRPQGQHAGAAVVGVAHQVDQHVDAIGADALGDRLTAARGHHREVIHAAADHCGDLVGDIDQGVGEDLETPAVVAGEQSMEQVAHRVVAEIGGEVADTEAPAGWPWWWRRQAEGGHAAAGGFGPAFAQAAVQGRWQRKQARGEGWQERTIPGLGIDLQPLAQPRGAVVVVVPVAEAEPVPLEVHEHFGGVWIKGQGALQFGNAGLGVAQRRQGLAELVMALALLRVLAQQPAEAGHGRLHPAQIHQGGSQLQQQIGSLRRGPQDHPQGLEGLVGAPLAAQQQGEGEEVVARWSEGGFQSQGLAVVPLGGIEIAAELQQGAAVGVGPSAQKRFRIPETTVGCTATRRRMGDGRSGITWRQIRGSGGGAVTIAWPVIGRMVRLSSGGRLATTSGHRIEESIEQVDGLAIAALAMQHLGELQPGGAMVRCLLQQLAVEPLRLWPSAGFLLRPGRPEEELQLGRFAAFPPFAQIGPLPFRPGRAPGLTTTGMQQRQGPGAEAQAGATCRTAEIEVVVVKGKVRIEAHARTPEGFCPCGEEHAIEQLHRHRRRSVDIQLAAGGRAVAQGTAEEGKVKAAAAGIQPPAHLTALMALVSRHPHQIEAGQCRLQLRSEGLGAEVHVVVAEHQHRAGRGSLDRGVVGDGERIAVGKTDPRHQLPVLRLPQRATQQRVVPEGRFLQPCCRNQLDHRWCHGRSTPSGSWGRSSMGLSVAARSA